MAQFITVPIFVVLGAALVAGFTDIRRFRVYNTLTLPLLGSGLLYHLLTGGASGLAWSFGGALLGFGALILLYVLGGMGAGDVKLMAAIGAWLGAEMTFNVLLASCLASGCYAVVLILARGMVGETIVNMHILWLRLITVGRYLGADDRIERELSRRDRHGRVIPFAAMVAVGMVAFLIWGSVREMP